MFEHRDPSGCKIKTFEVHASDFKLYEGARITPGSKIGKEIRSSKLIEIDRAGHIATAYYNPMNHSFLVMICLANDEANNQNRICA